MTSPPTEYVHMDLQRVHYSLTDSELADVRSTGQNHWKDFALVCYAVGVPCLLNAITEACRQVTFESTLTFNINLVIGIIGLVLGVGFNIAWIRTKKSLDALIDRIKNKPRIAVLPITDVGEMR